MTEPRPTNPDEGMQDPAVSALYSRAGDIQPPPHLDEAVLGEARRAIRRRSRRWILPLSTAAVLVIGVGLVLRIAVQPEFGLRPAGVPGTLTESAPAPQERQASPSANRRLQADEAAKPQPASPREFSTESLQEEPADPESARKKASAAPGGAPEAEMGMPVEKATPRLAPDELPQAAETPELWLTRIGELLSAGRRAEAKAQLAAFRRQYPDHPIPEELRELR